MFSSRQIRDFLFVAASLIAALAVAAAFILIVGDIVYRGLDNFPLSFLFTEPESAGRSGGILSVIISTLMIVGTSVIITAPIALGTALYLTVYVSDGSSIKNVLRTLLDTLAATPSIVFGLFGSALFCVYFDLGFSTLAGALTLSCMMLPTLIRMLEDGFRSVPLEYRRSAAALGISKVNGFFKIILPLTVPAATSALMLSIGRALSETAALLFTSGYVLRTPKSLLDSGRSLSVHIYDLALNVPGGDVNAYRSAFVLIAMIIALNLTALTVMRYWTKGLLGENGRRNKQY